jgi:hypothetical protein
VYLGDSQELLDIRITPAALLVVLFFLILAAPLLVGTPQRQPDSPAAQIPPQSTQTNSKHPAQGDETIKYINTNIDSPFRCREVGRVIRSSLNAGKIPLKTKYVRAVPRSPSDIPNGQMKTSDKTLRSWSSRTLSGTHYSKETLLLVRLPSGREKLGAIASTYLPCPRE